MGTSGSIVKTNQLQPAASMGRGLVGMAGPPRPKPRCVTLPPTQKKRPNSYVFQHKPDPLSLVWDQIWDYCEQRGTLIDDLVGQFNPQTTGILTKEELTKVFASLDIVVGAAKINDLCHENGDGEKVFLQSLFLRINGLLRQPPGATNITDPPSQRPTQYRFNGGEDALADIWGQIWTFWEQKGKIMDELILQYDINKTGNLSRDQLVVMLMDLGITVGEAKINDLCNELGNAHQVNVQELVHRIKGFLNAKREIDIGTPLISEPQINIPPDLDSLSPQKYQFRGQPDALKELWERMLAYCDRFSIKIDDIVLRFDRNQNGLISKEELIEMLADFEQNVGLAKINDLCHEHERNGEVDIKSLLLRIKGLSHEEEAPMPSQPPLNLNKMSDGPQISDKGGTKRPAPSKKSRECQVELMLPNSIEIATGTKMKIVKPNKPWRNGKQVVMKVLKCDDNDEVNDRRGEARINYRLGHIPRIIDVYEDKCLPHPAGGFQVIIVSEYAEQSSLDRLIKKRAETGNKFRENQLASFLFNAVEVLAAAEVQGIAHRDIKPGNILIFADGDFKICDFGVSREVGQDTMFETLVGTPQYFSYELMNAFVDRYEVQDASRTFDWFRNDVMSLAIVVIHMALLSTKVQLNARRSAESSQKKAFEDMAYLSNPFKNILKMMLALDPASRPNFTQLLETCKRLSFQQEKLAEPMEESKAPEVLRPTGLDPTLENATFNTGIKPGAQTGKPTGLDPTIENATFNTASKPGAKTGKPTTGNPARPATKLGPAARK